MMSQERYHKGITLVETLVSVALVSMVMLSIASYVTWSTEGARRDKANQYLLQEADYLVDKVLQSVRNGASIDTPAAGASGSSLSISSSILTDDPVVYTVSAGRLFESRAGALAYPASSPLIEVSDFNVVHRSSGEVSGVTVSISVTPAEGKLETSNVPLITRSGSALLR